MTKSSSYYHHKGISMFSSVFLFQFVFSFYVLCVLSFLNKVLQFHMFFPTLFPSGIRAIYVSTCAWYLIGIDQLRISWPSVWGAIGKFSWCPVFNLHCRSKLLSFPSDAQNMAMARKFRKLLSFKIDSRSSDIVNSNEFRTKDLMKSPSPDNF